MDDVLAEVKQHFNHKKKFAGYSGPLLVLHAGNDSLIDISHAERNHEWAGGSQKRPLRFPQGDNNTSIA